MNGKPHAATISFALLLMTYAGSACFSQSTADVLRISGQVVDDSGEPLSAARVMLVAATDFDRRLFADLDPDRGFVDLTTNADGTFILELDRHDTRFLIAGDSLLLAHADGREPAQIAVPIERILCGAPFEIRLSMATGTSIQVRSPEGESLSGVDVSAAVVRGQRLPWCVASSICQATSDETGDAFLPSIAADSIDSVFVSGPKIGLQRLGVRRDVNGLLSVTLLKTREVQGQASSVDRASIPGIASTRLFVITYPQGIASYGELPNECVWAIAPVQPDGRFSIDAACVGEILYRLSCPGEFAYRETYGSESTHIPDGDTPFHWSIILDKQVRQKATVIDGETGDPLPNIQIRCFDGRLEPTFTRADGTAEFYRLSNNVSYYPQDGLQEHFLTDAFFLDSNKVPINGEIELDPVRMVRSLPPMGRVIDAEGNTVAGAKVTYEFGQERFTRTETTFCADDGSFRLYAVPAGTSLNIQAIKGDWASDAQSVAITPDQQITLTLMPRPSRAPAGRIVDLSGQPVSGVAVSIQLGRVMVKEGYSAEELHFAELYDNSPTVRTDSSGRFEFPPTIDFANRLQVQVRDPSFFPYFSPFIDGSQLTATESSQHFLELGDFALMRRPDSRRVEFSVTSESGDPVQGARVLVVGARTGTRRGTTDNRGKCSLVVPDGRSIVGVQADGFRIHFSRRDAATDTESVLLTTTDTVEPERPTDSIRDLSPGDFDAAAKRIFSQIELPDPGATTLHRLRLYYESLSVIDPEEFLRTATADAKLNPQFRQAAMSAALTAIGSAPELIDAARDADLIPPEYAYTIYLTAANATQDSELRNDYWGEALVSVREISGAERLYASATLAKALLASGRVDLARDIIEEAWSAATNLQQILATGERQLLIGESRTIAPMLAIIDLERARKLIELTATEVEIPRLVTEARLIGAEVDPEKFIDSIRSQTVEPLDEIGVQSWLRTRSQPSATTAVGLPIPDEIAASIQDEKMRLRFLLFHARQAVDADLRRRLLRQAIETIYSAKSTLASDHFLFHYTGAILEELRKTRQIPDSILQELVFATLWNLPEAFETDRLQTVLGAASQIVAFHDRKLAKWLLAPAMEDHGWLFMGRHLSLDGNETLRSVAAIDPDWSVEVVNQLCELDLREDPSGQLQVRSGMISALMSTKSSNLSPSAIGPD